MPDTESDQPDQPDQPEMSEVPAAPGVPQMPAQPPAPPAQPPTSPASPAPPPRSRRRARAAVRWTAAVLVFAAFGAAATYAVTRPARTDVPGLATPGDGRWTYPPVALPKLPAGEPRPLAGSNRAGRHYADERSLLLPLPEQAVADRAFPGTSGWLPDADYLKLFELADPAFAKTAALELADDGLRHIAARAWTMPDGTRTEVYLLQFLTAGCLQAYATDASDETVKGAEEVSIDPHVQSAAIPQRVLVEADAEDRPYGATAARYAFITSGDTLGLVLQTRKGSLPEVPFAQAVRTQAQLLG